MRTHAYENCAMLKESTLAKCVEASRHLVSFKLPTMKKDTLCKRGDHMATSAQDQWAQWLLQRRFGGNPQQLQAMLEVLSSWRDRILQNARLAPGEHLLDVGCGDGLVAFEALDRVGSQGKVIFSDISQDLLDHSFSL